MRVPPRVSSQSQVLNGAAALLSLQNAVSVFGVRVTRYRFSPRRLVAAPNIQKIPYRVPKEKIGYELFYRESDYSSSVAQCTER